jgi:cysteine desulfurase
MGNIYLDYNASTPVHPAVVAAMQPFLAEAFGNPSSAHWASHPAQSALRTARQQVASLLNCAPDEIVFTSGGSEGNNLAIKGTFFARRAKGNHIITQATEHPSVLNVLRFLEGQGATVTYLDVDHTGVVDPRSVRDAINEHTILITIMHANNETGTLQPIEAISAIARDRGIVFHTDAAQSVGKIPTRVDSLGVDLLTIAGHKLYAPKGVGALYVREGLVLEPVIHGASHERGRRAGTESTLLAVGLGTAAVLASDLLPMARICRLRDNLWQVLRASFGKRVVLNGHASNRLPNTLNVSFAGSVGAEILARLEGVAASTGSACHAGAIDPSPVLEAMKLPSEIALGAIRFSLGRDTSENDLQTLVERLHGAVPHEV